MNMSISTDIMSATISEPMSGYRPPPPPDGVGGAELPNAVSVIEQTGSTMTDNVKGSLLAGAVELDKSGASFEDIKSFVDTELEANGIGFSDGYQRSGQLVDMMS